MYASFHKREMTYADLFRDCAAVSAGVLGAMWIAFLVTEAVRTHEFFPNEHSFLQAIALAVVFAAYIVGWRHGVLGVSLAVAGTIALFFVAYWTVGVLPPLAAAWFAVPGVLYFLAWFAERRTTKQPLSSDDSPTQDYPI